MNNGAENTVFFDSFLLNGWGYVGITWSRSGLLQLVLPQPTREEAISILKATHHLPNSCLVPSGFYDRLKRELDEYFKGRRRTFAEYPLDLRGATLFQREVWAVVSKIPYGECRTYGWVARRLGRKGGARAVGQALRHNPLPVLIPCHRVILTSGRPGGFSAGWEWKKRLLQLESQKREVKLKRAWSQ